MFRLGVIGLSPGNGHPYSWAAICNGYNADAMADCPFPAIPAYLGARRFPEDAIQDARVEAVWCQDRAVAEHVARAARIERVVERPTDLLDGLDAILLARDDAENHRAFAEPFLNAGLPVFIDKPLGVRLADADTLLDLQRDPAQIHSCSAFRYIPDLPPAASALPKLGRICRVDAEIGKAWATYAVHVLEPAVRLLNAIEPPAHANVDQDDGATTLTASWHDGRTLRAATLGIGAPPVFRIEGEHDTMSLQIDDPFFYFRTAIEAFVEQMRTGTVQIPREQTRATVRLIERGMQERG